MEVGKLKTRCLMAMKQILSEMTIDEVENLQD